MKPNPAMPKIFLLAGTVAVMLFAAGPAAAAQLSAEDQYVDTGPTGNGIDTILPGGAGPTAPGSSPAGVSPTANGISAAASEDGGGDRKGGRHVVASGTGPGQTEGGSLPLAGYPLTPLVGIVLALLAISLTIQIVKRLSELRTGQET